MAPQSVVQVYWSAVVQVYWSLLVVQVYWSLVVSACSSLEAGAVRLQIEKLPLAYLFPQESPLP